MKQVLAKFQSLPTFRPFAAGIAGIGSFVAAGTSFAAGIADGATASIAEAQSSGETVGAAVVACVAALCVVGVIIALVRKV
ncbi:hypothetical protein AABC73_13495 [Pseudomonas sp. G.S.17]|uniref:hypothetical protein n=1 Tax=Pseudomonas sp. G.S.17 TaxID=3137451 RepID=UPI00311C90CD